MLTLGKKVLDSYQPNTFASEDVVWLVSDTDVETSTTTADSKLFHSHSCVSMHLLIWFFSK